MFDREGTRMRTKQQSTICPHSYCVAIVVQFKSNPCKDYTIPECQLPEKGMAKECADDDQKCSQQADFATSMIGQVLYCCQRSKRPDQALLDKRNAIATEIASVVRGVQP
jgi:hypothetical protein